MRRPCTVDPVRSVAVPLPGRVFKGTRMSGRMGNDRITTQNLLVHKVDAENGVLLIKGAIPGRNGGLVMVRSAIKRGEK